MGNFTLKPHRGKKSTMSASTLVLKAGEIFVEYPDSGVGTGSSNIKIGDGTTQYKSLPYAINTNEIERQISNIKSDYLKRSGGTMTGDINFQATDTTGTSKKIIFSGSTDGAEIYYNVPASDQGNLVLNMKDDANAYIQFAYNGTVHSYISPSDGYYHGDFVNGVAKTISDNVTNNTGDNKKAGTRHTLEIYGPTYGNDANYIKTAGRLSYGDPGPQIVFNTQDSLANGQHLALIYTDNDTIATGVSLSLVSDQNDAWFIAPHIKALSGFSGELTGNAATATTLKNARNIRISSTNGSGAGENVSFNGSSDITVKLPKNITMSGQLITSFRSSVAPGCYQASATTIPNLINELRYSSGAMGSVNITTAYGSITTGWYNFFYSPHRSGGENGAASGDNCDYGSLILIGMTVANAAWIVQYQSSAIKGYWTLRPNFTWSNVGGADQLVYFSNGNATAGTSASTNATKNTIVKRDNNNYVWFNYINTNVGQEASASSSSSFLYANSDGWIRKSNLSNYKTAMALNNVDNTADTNKTVNKLKWKGNHAETASGTGASAPTAGVADGQGLYLTGTYNDAATPVNYGNIVNIIGSGSGQLLAEWSGADSTTGHLYYRSHRDTSTGGWGAWKKVVFDDDVYDAGDEG